jgi:hypothetical protein
MSRYWAALLPCAAAAHLQPSSIFDLPLSSIFSLRPSYFNQSDTHSYYLWERAGLRMLTWPVIDTDNAATAQVTILPNICVCLTVSIRRQRPPASRCNNFDLRPSSIAPVLYYFPSHNFVPQYVRTSARQPGSHE